MKPVKRTALCAIVLALCVVSRAEQLAAQERGVGQVVDSLFVIASSGELKYRDSVEPAKEALAALGAPATPFLIDKLTTPDARERLTVIRIIQKIGAPAVPHLREALRTRSNALQLKRICWAVGDLGADGRSALPEISISTRHSDWQVREYALRALGKVGDTLGEGLSLEIQLEDVRIGLSDPVAQVRKSACWAAGVLRMARLSEELVVALDDDYYGARLNASRSLAQLGQPAIQPLIDCFESPDQLEKGNLACETLGRLCATSPDSLAVARLQEQLRHNSPERRAAAARSLGACAGPLESSELTLLQLTERDPYVLQAIEMALSDITARASD